MPEFTRSSGIIMHISSLPSPYGIGTLGKCAHEFAQFLFESGQTIWQMLPLGPTGFGNSPYQSFSSFAGNPYFIDLDLINTCDVDLSKYDWGNDNEKADFGKLYQNRFCALREIYEHSAFDEELSPFVENNADWILDYALFSALKRHFSGMPWYLWPEDIRSRDKESLEQYRILLKDDIEFEYWMQYQFFKQFDALKAKCNELGIKLMGDIPFYVSPDSADIWANAEEFLLDEKFRPTEVAGVPPDYFSETGQLWGNPLYNWEKMSHNGYRWWMRRIGTAANMYDIIRLDHFRAFESYWSVPYGSETAAEGKWNPGPGEKFMDTLSENYPNTLFLAEDLGIITDKVRALRKYAKMPGMAILSFAFDPDHESSYLPHNLEKDCVCYTGTHDNSPLYALLYELSSAQMKFIKEYCGSFDGIIRMGMTSCAKVFMTQMQDWLELGPDSRMNTPGSDEECWLWRIKRLPSKELADKIYRMTQVSCRCRKKEENSI